MRPRRSLKTLKLLYTYAKPFRMHFLLGLFTLFLVDALGVVPPLLLKNFVDQAKAAFEGDRRAEPFVQLALIFAAVAIGQGVLRFLWRIFLIRASFWAGERVREAYFAKLQKLPPSFYDKHPIGDLMALATNDVEAIRFAMGPGLLVFSDAVFVILLMTPTMLFLSPKLTFFAYLPMVALPFIVARYEKKVHDRFEEVQAHYSKLSSFAQENIDGIKVIKSFAREKTQLFRFSNLGKEFIRLNVKLVRSQSILEQAFGLSITLGLVSLILFGGPDVISGVVSLGTFVAFTRYLENMAWPMMAFGMAVTHYQRGKTSLERIHDVLTQKEEPETVAPLVASERKAQRDPSVPLFEARGLTFSYSEHAMPALKNLTFKIGKNSRTAIVGPIGCGKSTIVKLMTGLYEVPQGMLFLDGTDVTQIPLHRRRELLSIAPQETLLFSETLAWNVAFGQVNDEQKREIEKHLDCAGLSREWRRWGLDSLIGERGSNVSGGQRARIALARALYKKAPLLVLDDTLSSIDVETENDILSRLSTFSDGIAVLMITHRISNLRGFDQILVLNQGEIVQQGTPQELLDRQGPYNDLVNLQRMENVRFHG